MNQATLDLGGVFETRENPRTPASPLSLTQSRKLHPEMRARPRFISSTPRGFRPDHVMTGYLLLGMDPYPQNIEVAAVLEATKPNGKKLHDEAVIVMPRRASKTTGIWAVLLGRCMHEPGHRVAFSAQNGVKASEIFLEIATQVERAWAANNPEWAEPPFRVKRGAGHERIEFTNGSVIQAYPPDAKSFRSAAADTVYIDESQEHGPAKAEEIIGGVFPLMDTKASPQMIYSGTPGTKREGLLWVALERGRAGSIGIVEYSADDDADVTNPKKWATWHPGIGTLTDHETIAKRFDMFPLLQFRREYCCQWPLDVTDKAIDPKLWESARTPWERRTLDLPRTFAVGFEVAIDQSSAAVAVAWHDDDGDAHVEIIAHREHDGWLAKFLSTCAANGRGVAFGFDSIGNNLTIADELQRSPRGRPRLIPFSGGKPTAAATAAFFTRLKSGTLHHYDQPSLNAAADGAGRRGSSSETTGWYWARRSNADVSPLIAATIALGTLEKQPRGGRASFGGNRDK